MGGVSIKRGIHYHRNILDRLGISEYLNRPEVTAATNNRPGEVFIDKPDGVIYEEIPDLDFKTLLELANALPVFNLKQLAWLSPSTCCHAVRSRARPYPDSDTTCV